VAFHRALEFQTRRRNIINWQTVHFIKFHRKAAFLKLRTRCTFFKYIFVLLVKP